MPWPNGTMAATTIFGTLARLTNPAGTFILGNSEFRTAYLQGVSPEIPVVIGWHVPESSKGVL
jgi:hypothetical protein